MINKNGLTQTLEAYNFTNELKIDNFTRQAFYQGRMKLKPEIFKIMNKKFLEDFYKNENFKTFKKYKLLAIDGSLTDLPNNKNLMKEFGGIKGSHNKFIKLKAQTSGIYDCLNNMMIDFQIAPYQTSEKELAYKNIKNTLKLFKNNEIILIFDRGYPSIELFNYLKEKNIKFIFRIKKDSYKEKTKQTQTNDEYIELKTKTKEKLKLRLVKIPLKNEKSYLITNLRKKEAKYNEINKLYKQRWEIEKSFEVLKNKLYLENISGYTKIAVQQDYHSQILTQNIIQDIKNKANQILKEKQKQKNRKNKIQKTLKKKKEKQKKVNINHLIGYFRKNILKIYQNKNSKEKYKILNEIINLTLKSYTYETPNRHFKRIKKRTTPKNKTNIRRNS